MQTKEVILKNRAGMHVRPASLIVKKAEQFKSDIFLEKEDFSIDAKSIMAVITLGAVYKSVVTIRAEGEDEEAAIEAIVELFENRFEEE